MPRTYRALTDGLERLGALTPAEAEDALVRVRSWSKDPDEETDPGELLAILHDLPIAAYVPDKVDDLEEAYRGILEDAAACSRGSVTIDDIEMVDVDGVPYLHFRRNGRSIWWSLEHLSPRYVDLLTIAENFGDLAPSDHRDFFHVETDDGAASGWYVLLTHEQGRMLREEFGLPLDHWGYTGPADAVITATPGTTAWYVEDDRARMGEPARRFLDDWLAGMDTALERRRPAGLDFTPASLPVLEAQILERFSDGDSVRADDEFVEDAVRYIGETILRTWPSHWIYRHSDEPGYLDNVPMVRANTPIGFPGICVPLYAITHLAQDREPGTLLRAATKVRDAIDLHEQARLARTRGDPTRLD
ncbi:hypothetical protein [Actinomadura sp. 9N407]|uniref:hypothetical protein n=1 Tax=Actinomadura sp. 9N407 TaxID=3375154 RepID=UPI003791BDE9